VTLADQVADVRAAIAWVRTHAAGYGAGPGPLFVTGSSAGANLAIRAVCDGETAIAGLICRYGYYGDPSPTPARTVTARPSWSTTISR
jgi:acetyl esterase/lipase